MPVDLDHMFAGKHSIVNELFIKTADENYVVARWCFFEGLDVDFFWLAVHAVEKYLKAVLLLNGRPTKSYGHNIPKLYAAIFPLASELLPQNLSKPRQFADNLHWIDETPDLFLKRLYRGGRADNRYQLFGYVRHSEDLFKLDQMIFAIRSLCHQLDAHFLTKKQPDVSDHSIRGRMRMGRDTV
jgi:HEPN domain-containing protein